MRAVLCKQLVTHCITMAPSACAACREGAAGRFLYALAALGSPRPSELFLPPPCLPGHGGGWRRGSDEEEDGQRAALRCEGKAWCRSVRCQAMEGSVGSAGIGAIGGAAGAACGEESRAGLREVLRAGCSELHSSQSKTGERGCPWPSGSCVTLGCLVLQKRRNRNARPDSRGGFLQPRCPPWHPAPSAPRSQL